jgi:hypothetical protein
MYHKWFKWTDKDNTFQTGVLSYNAVCLSVALKSWAETAEIGETIEHANTIYERVEDTFSL